MPANPRTTRLCLLSAAMILASGTHAGAQPSTTPPQSTPANTPTNTPANPPTRAPGQTPARADTPSVQSPVLAGPRVGGARAGDTLVKRDFNGHVLPLDTSPQEAALALLDMSRDERAAAQRVLNERARAVDEAIGSNIPLLLKIQSLAGAPASERTRLLREVTAATRPLRERGTVMDELARVLSPVHAAEVRRLSGEYEEAIIAQRIAQAGEMGTRMTRTQAVATERLHAAGQEIKRSYDRVAGSRAARLEEVIATLKLNADQEDRVREVIRRQGEQSLSNPSPAGRREAFAAVLEILDARQRRDLIAFFAPGNDEKKK